MRGLPLAALLGALLAAPSPAAAQAAPALPSRADVTGTLGWLNVNKTELSQDDWYNKGLLGSVTAGWYWTAHLKTEIEASASGAVESHASEEAVLSGTRRFVHAIYRFGTRRIAIGQQYQFGENAWFHPYLAAGLDLNWERTRREDEPPFVFDPATGRGLPIGGAIRPPIDRTDLHARPYAAAGFKAYTTQRSFFRGDLRFVAGDRLEEVMLRVGFGLDF
jgi:hypothetical protein